MPRSQKIPPANAPVGTSKEELPWAKREVTNPGGTRGHLGSKKRDSASQKVGRYQNAAARKIQKGF